MRGDTKICDCGKCICGDERNLRIAEEAIEWASEVGCENGGPVDCFETWPESHDDWCRACGIRSLVMQFEKLSPGSGKGEGE